MNKTFKSEWTRLRKDNLGPFGLSKETAETVTPEPGELNKAELLLINKACAQMSKQGNPWAICHGQGLEGDKFEACVLHVKEKVKSMQKSVGDEVTINWKGKEVKVTVIRENEDGTIRVKLPDGTLIHVSPSRITNKSVADDSPPLETTEEKAVVADVGNFVEGLDKETASDDVARRQQTSGMRGEFGKDRGFTNIEELDKNHVSVTTDQGEFVIARTDKMSGGMSGMRSYGGINGDWRMIEMIYEDVQAYFKEMDSSKKAMDVSGAGPVPNSLLAEQDLEGKETTKGEKYSIPTGNAQLIFGIKGTAGEVFENKKDGILRLPAGKYKVVRVTPDSAHSGPWGQFSDMIVEQVNKSFKGFWKDVVSSTGQSSKATPYEMQEIKDEIDELEKDKQVAMQEENQLVTMDLQSKIDELKKILADMQGAKKSIPDIEKYYGDVVYELEKLIGATTSDAQGICDLHHDIIDDGYADERTPAETAKKVSQAATPKQKSIAGTKLFKEYWKRVMGKLRKDYAGRIDNLMKESFGPEIKDEKEGEEHYQELAAKNPGEATQFTEMAEDEADHKMALENMTKTAGSQRETAERLMSQENAIWNKLGIHSGTELDASPALQEKYHAEVGKLSLSGVDAGVMAYLENENYHSLIEELMKRGAPAPNWDLLHKSFDIRKGADIWCYDKQGNESYWRDSYNPWNLAWVGGMSYWQSSFDTVAQTKSFFQKLTSISDGQMEKYADEMITKKDIELKDRDQWISNWKKQREAARSFLNKLSSAVKVDASV